MMFNRFKGSWWIGIVGNWQEVEGGSIHISGFSYWISPPRDFMTFLTEPLHSLVYVVFMMASCAFFSRYPIHHSGFGSRYPRNLPIILLRNSRMRK
jgi:protein transport protein SEC61 subunit alpha